MKYVKILLALGMIVNITFFVSGCATMTVGQEFPSNCVAQIDIGETTKLEVIDTLGPPWQFGLEDGYEIWIYGHYDYSRFSKAQCRRLVVRFDSDDIVSSYTYNTTAHNIE